MTKKTLHLLILFFFGLLIGCKPIEPEPEIKHCIPQEFKDYTVFKEGTWWAYEDSATGEVDTFKVKLYNSDFSHTNKYKNLKNHYFEVIANNVYVKDTLFAGFGLYIITDENPQDYYFAYENHDIGGGVLFPLFHYSKIDSIDTDYLSKSIYYKNYKDFSNVIESTPLNDSPGSNLYLYAKYNQFITIWYAKNIGPIKYKLRNGQILNLKNYHIIQ